LKNDKWEELKTAVLSDFENNEQANIFISEIVKKYPRRASDQLSIIQKQQKKYDKNELFHALNYCTPLELFSANDFRDTLEYFKTAHPEPVKTEVILPVKSSVVKAEIRDSSAYSAACFTGGGA
jgi:hypothetical protein